jgi:predicted secreted protein
MAVIEIDQNANGTDVHLCVGDELKLTLPENRSGGYHWELGNATSSALRVLGDEFDPGSAPRFGSPGARHWIFKACEVIRTTLELQSKRSWGDGPPSKGFKCNVVIEQPAD